MRILPVGAAFGHMVRSTVNNLGFAWHLSWPWMCVIIPVNIAAVIYGFTLEPAPSPAVTGPDDVQLFKFELQGVSGWADSPRVAVAILIAALTLFSFASIAVSWHRYVLLDEVPRGWARLRADNTVWRYFGNTLLITVLLLIGMIPVMLLASVPMAMGNAGAILSLVIYLAGIIYAIASFYRLSVKLPAVALERHDFGLKDAWAATTGNVWRLFGLAILFFLAAIGAALLIGGIAYLLEKTGLSFALFFGIALQIVFNWIVTIMGVTLLTSLYGFFVEGREF